MIGQFSNTDFLAKYPNANINVSLGFATTRFGRETINYWTQHDDLSWTNYRCRTSDEFRFI